MQKSLLKMMKYVIMLQLLFISFSEALGQATTVSGRVTSETGDGLPGVTVVLKGTTIGASTDSEGNYSLNIPDGTGTLVISFIGYSSQEIPIENRSTINVSLAPDAEALEEVVVVGYGTQKKESLTASVGTVKGEEIAQQPVANISNAIGGRVAGVIFTQGSGEPGYDGSNIMIRGIGTTGSTSPLVIVDGVQRSFTQLDPNSIASISILKDAAAVAPYGMAGANGVILITTKKGKSGSPSLTYSTYVGWQNPTRLTKFVNAYEYATLINAANDNEGAPHVYSGDDLQKFRDHSSPDTHHDHNVLKELITPNALMSNHNLQVSGGADRVRYYVGLGYLSQQGMWGPTNYKRYNLIANMDADVTNTTNVSLSINGSVEDRNFPAVSSGSIFYQAFRTPPVAPLTFSNGLWGGYIGRSAYGNIFHSGNQKGVGYTLLNQLSIEQQLPFIKGLSVKGALSYDFNPSLGRRWLTPIPYYTYDPATQTYPQAGSDGPASPQYYVDYSQSQALTYQGYLNYQNTFGKHDITGLIVLEARNTTSTVFGAGRKNYNVTIPELNNGSSNSTDISNHGYSSEGKQKSALYRITYGYDGKYLLEVSGRYDGNYYFAPGKRFGFFPAFSAGWRISEEDFFNVSWVNSLKLRGSYGESGALAGRPFQYLSSYTLYGNAYVFNGASTQGLYESSEPNTNITWERAKKTDIGLEATLWNGLFTIEADYFFEIRNDMLFPPTVTVPIEYGIGLSQVNSGAMSNRGIEFALGSSHRFSNDLHVSLNTNLTFARNRLLEVFETDATYNNPNRRITGRPTGTQFGYKALGYFTPEDFDQDGTLKEGIPAQPWGPVHPGDLRYEDTDGDGKFTPDDQVVIGHPAIPEIIYGINPGITYKGFDLSLLFQGATNRDFYISGEAAWPFVNSASATVDNLDYWTPDNLDAINPRITAQPAPNNTQTSSWWVKNGSYLRLKTGELGYTLPTSLMSRIKMQSARVYLSGQNVLTWSPIKNFDPEISVSGGQYYPQQRVLSLGLNVTF